MSVDAYITIAILALTFGLLIKTKLPPVAVFVAALALCMSFDLAPSSLAFRLHEGGLPY